MKRTIKANKKRILPTGKCCWAVFSNERTASLPKPKKVKCFKCKKEFYIKFVISRLSYSQKNNWGYWTEKEKNKSKSICNKCLLQIYQDKINYWKAVQSPKKRNLFRVYLYNGTIA